MGRAMRSTVVLGTVLALWPGLATCASSASHTLWFPNPSYDWLTALPIGNGRLGAMVHGYIDREVISLNEDSIWSGGFQDRVNPNAAGALQRVRTAMDEGRLTDAGEDWLNNLSGNPLVNREYQPAGDLVIETGHDRAAATAFNRTLDVSKGFAYTTYALNGVVYERHAVASFHANVLAFRFKASRSRSISLKISLTRDRDVVSTSVADGQITLRGFAKDDSGFTFTSAARVVATGGSTTVEGSSIRVTNANEVVIYWDAETLFRFPEGATRYEQVLNSRLQAAVQRGFSTIMQDATLNHTNLYNRVSVDLGDSGSAGRLNTLDRLLALINNNDMATDPEFMALMYNFGRHLFISSVRPGSMPPNLQGVWNNNFYPPWGSKYTIDVNLQMNYWAADMINFPESHEPLWNLMRSMQNRGTDVARKMYGAKGWVCHHNTDLWGDCAPHDRGTLWTIWPMGGAWMLSHTIEHYRYTLNTTFARNVALPLLSGALEFYYDFAVLQNGTRVTYPSNSPENYYVIPQGKTNAGQTTGIDKSSQMDRALLWDIFSGFIELSKAVGSTAGVSAAEQFLAQIQAPSVSATTGRLLEWSEDYVEAEPDHRHFSPVFGLHPGVQYSPLKNPQIATAAANLHEYRLGRGSGSTGWSRIWSSLIFARGFKGDLALNDATTLITNYLYSNLFTRTSGVFQIDANFGLVALVHELYLQSNTDGIIHIGPAMPSKLAGGSFKGWITRGGFQVDAEWKNGQITGARVTVKNGNKVRPLALRVQDGRQFMVNGATYTGPLQASPGSTYTITF